MKAFTCKDAKACGPAAVVFGDVSTGKSKATRASLALLGMEDACATQKSSTDL